MFVTFGNIKSYKEAEKKEEKKETQKHTIIFEIIQLFLTIITIRIRILNKFPQLEY